MFWLFLRLVAMPYLSIKVWLKLRNQPHFTVDTRPKSHQAINAHLTAELSRMHASVNPRYRAFERLSWIVFVLVQCALVFLNLFISNVPDIIFMSLLFIQAIAASLVGFLIFFYLNFIAQFTPNPTYSHRRIDFYLISSMHRDWCFLSALIMFSTVFFQSKSIEWGAYFSVVGFFTAMVILSMRAEVFRHMSENSI
jgi:hypothetical protein